MFTRVFATLQTAKSAFTVTYTFIDFDAVFVMRLLLRKFIFCSLNYKFSNNITLFSTFSVAKNCNI